MSFRYLSRIIILHYLCFFIFQSSVYSQNTTFRFNIIGDFPGFRGNGIVHLRSLGKDQKPFRDSAVIVKGKFDFEGELDNPKLITLILLRDSAKINALDRDLLTVFIDSNITTIKITDSLKNAIVRGSSEHERYVRFLAEYEKVISLYGGNRETMNKYESGDTNVDLFKVKESIKNIRVKSDSIINFFVTKNNSSFVSLYALNRGVGETENPFIYEELFSKLHEKIKNSNYGQAVHGTILNVQKRFTLKAMPDLALADTLGKLHKIQNDSGKYIFVDFWASWCYPCRQQFPSLKKIYSHFSPKGLKIIGISVDNIRTDWIKAIKGDKLPWQQLSDLRGFQNQLAEYFGISAVPYNILIDPDGRIIGKDLLIKELEELLTRLLPG